VCVVVVQFQLNDKRLVLAKNQFIQAQNIKLLIKKMMAQKCGNRHHYYFRTAFITVPSSQLIATSSANSRNGNPTHSTLHIAVRLIQ